MLKLIHSKGIFERRVKVLARSLVALLPDRGTVLDVGCGNGRVGKEIMRLNPGLIVRGLEVLPRSEAHIPVDEFDGRTLPIPTESVDAVMFVDVLHHTDNQKQLLTEAVRCARRCVVIKDHYCEDWYDRLRLKAMDWVGNARYGVPLPYHYFSQRQWDRIRAELALSVDEEVALAGLYIWPLEFFFGGGLHFIAKWAARDKPDALSTDVRGPLS